jgi:integrase
VAGLGDSTVLCGPVPATRQRLSISVFMPNRKGVLLQLRWTQVDFEEGVIWFTKKRNRKPVPVAAPIYGDMREWLVRQKAFRDEHFPDCDYVFFWYPIDCEIDPIFKAGHGGLRTKPGTPLKLFTIDGMAR